MHLLASVFAAMGRVRTKTVKKAARVIVEKYYAKLTLDFQVNKKIAEEDLSSNISRETLQQNKFLRVIKKHLAKKCLEMLAEIAEKKGDDKKCHEQFGKWLKLGVHEDSTFRTKVAELIRFCTSKSGDEQTCFKENDHMGQGQAC